MKGLFVKICLIGLILSACASAPTTPPGPNESEVIVNYSSTSLYRAKGTLNVFLDGVRITKVKANSSERIIVPNGAHTIMVRKGKQDNNTLTNFEASSQRVVFNVNRTAQSFTLTRESTTALSTQYVGVIGAARKAGSNLLGKLPRGANIAVLSVAASDVSTSNSVISELEFALVNSNQYTIVDRASLNTIRTTQNFQLSSDVSDELAVSIGQLLGASIVITGSINETSTSKSLSVKALDVGTAQIIAIEREFY